MVLQVEGEKGRSGECGGNGEKGAVIGLRVLVYSGNSTDEWGNVLVLHPS